MGAVAEVVAARTLVKVEVAARRLVDLTYSRLVVMVSVRLVMRELRVKMSFRGEEPLEAMPAMIMMRMRRPPMMPRGRRTFLEKKVSLSRFMLMFLLYTNIGGL